MPNIDGIELMRRVKAKRPEVIRGALSGFTESKQILNSLDSGLARLYLYKPWDNEELVSIIEGLMAMVSKLSHPHLVQTINGLGSLPTFPSIYNRVVTLIDKDASASDISKVIEQDPAIAAKILRIANTAYYGSHTGSIKQAIMMLGMTNVRQIILTNALFESTESLPFGHDLWRHAALTNKGVGLLYQLCFQKNLPVLAGAIGLMHTVGLLLLATLKTEAYRLLIDKAQKNIKNGISFELDALEREAYGVTHWEVGSFLLNWWELPFEIIEAAFNYRHPNLDEINNSALVGIVHYVSHMVFEKLNLTCFQFPLEETLLDKAGVTEENRALVATFIDQMIQRNEVENGFESIALRAAIGLRANHFPNGP